MIFLCGLPYVGKTTCGKRVASMLNCSFTDLDCSLETLYLSKTDQKKACREIYREEGEEIFRRWEKEALFNLEKEVGGVVALGGGTLELLENREFIHSMGELFYLKSSPEHLFQRMQSPYPSYLDESSPEESFLKLAEKRGETYEREASVVVDLENLDLDAAVSQIIEQMKGRNFLGK